MKSLHELGLISFLQDWAKKGRPILGICLGMQVLAACSYEGVKTEGLHIIEGQVKPLSPNSAWHIGWNKIEQVHRDSIFSPFSGEYFYFNHSFAFTENTDAMISHSYCERYFPAIVRHGQVVGLQFHPEKSQDIGKELLSSIIKGLCNGS